MTKDLHTVVYTAFFTFFFFFVNTTLAQTIFYVDQNATGSNDGLSWANAMTDIQQALATASEGDEIWVVAGTYLPGDTLTSTFFIEKNVRLYGGFAGNETILAERDPALFETILSGDLNNDDLPGDFEYNRADNVRNVLLVSDAVTNATLIDGFTIRGGHAAGDDSEFFFRRGGGLFSFGAPVVRQCVFQGNFADAEGGGAYFHGPKTAGALVDNCLFSANNAKNGAGAMVFYTGAGMVTFENCSFEKNSASENGGAIQVFNSNFQAVYSTFTNNNAGRNGGAIDSRTNTDDLETTLVNCVFLDNKSRTGGAVRWQTSSGLGSHNNRLTATACTFSANRAILADTTEQGELRGGALSVNIDRTTNDAVVRLDDCVFAGNNSGQEGSAVHASLEGLGIDFQANNCFFGENNAATNGGLLLHASDLATGEIKLNDCLFFLNTAQKGGALLIEGEKVSSLSFLVQNSIFAQNFAEISGAGLYAQSKESAVVALWLSNCQFDGNSSQQLGGALCLAAGNPGLQVAAHACLFTENLSPHGAAIATVLLENQPAAGAFLALDNCLLTGQKGATSVVYNVSFPDLRLVNCTSAGNLAGSLLSDTEGGWTLQNSIFFNPPFQELQYLNGGAAIVSKGGNIAWDGSLFSFFNGTDQLNTDPLFDDSGSFPYELSQNSPAVDGGILPDDVPLSDFAGNARVNGCIDAGAFESPYLVSSECLTPWRERLDGFSRLSVSPNPVEDFLSLTLENDWQGTVHLRILNLLGQEVESSVLLKNNDPENWQLNLNSLQSGIYSVQLSNGSQSRVGLFVKN